MIELSVAEEQALHEHLQANEGIKLGEHIYAGGTYASYVQAWKTNRDAAAAGWDRTEREDGLRVLALPVREQGNWPGGTAYEFFTELLVQFWNEELRYGICGDSDWRYALYEALNIAGLIPGWREGYGVGHRADGSNHHEDREHADALILAAIRALPYFVREETDHA